MLLAEGVFVLGELIPQRAHYGRARAVGSQELGVQVGQQRVAAAGGKQGEVWVCGWEGV